MKVLLIQAANAKYKAYYAKTTGFPNGILFIAAVLEQAGHDVMIYDQMVDARRPEDFKDFSPDLLGFTVIAGPHLEGSIAVTKEFRSLYPTVPIAWGNIHPSVLSEQCLQQTYIDYVVVGAGEFTMLDLCNSLSQGSPKLEEIQGLAFKKDGKIVFNGCRPFVQNLDDLPDPAWHLIDVPKYTSPCLNTSRGCSNACSFCYNKSYNKGYYAAESAERILEQVQILQTKYGIKDIRLSEDNFTFNRKRLREFCNLIIDRKIKLKWWCDARCDLSETDVALMAKAGCHSVGLGVESGSQRMLDFMNKGITVAEAEKTFWLLIKYRIRTTCYVLYGLPTETVDDFNQTQALLKRLDNPYYFLNRFVPFPGSDLFDYCVHNNLIEAPQKLEDWPAYIMEYSTKINLTNCPESMLSEAATNFRNNYAVQRFRFTFKHNKRYFLNMFKNPLQFMRDLRDLVVYHFQINVFSKTIRRRVTQGAISGKGVMASLAPKGVD